eukprot:GHVH01007372.1.p1 GENE.GHVH01007372.1~~GHVH01007372.1.p1  ORF type:complete len:294 (+),score=24.10 GHVH01007372.1:912-1793(+)
MMLVYKAVESDLLSFKVAGPIFTVCGLPFIILFYITIPKNRQALTEQLTRMGVDGGADLIYKPRFRDLVQTFRTWDVPVFAFLWYMPLVMSNNAYMTCVAVLASDSVSHFMGSVQAFQGLFCICFASLAVYSRYTFVRWFPYFVLLFGSFLGLLSLVVGAENDTWQKGAATMFVIANTYIFASKYVWGVMVIDDAVYGIICGFISAVTGVVQMTNVLWRSLLMSSLDIFVEIYIIVVCCVSILGLFLFTRIHRGKVDHVKHIVSERADLSLPLSFKEPKEIKLYGSEISSEES